jgi:hypothetical protein
MAAAETVTGRESDMVKHAGIAISGSFCLSPTSGRSVSRWRLYGYRGPVRRLGRLVAVSSLSSVVIASLLGSSRQMCSSPTWPCPQSKS